MAIDGIYELTLRQSWGSGGENLLNKFFFQKAGTGETAHKLAEAFDAASSWLSKINLIQESIVNNVDISVINLGDPTDFDVITASLTGGYSGDALPPHSAVNFTLKLNTRVLRPGSKRFSGVPESVQVNGVITDSTYITALNGLRTIMETDLAGLTTDIYRPVVIKRVPYTVALPTTHTAYRLPTTDEELSVGIVKAVVLNTRISHQTSRGNGR
jgi:hypothetical protein